MCCVDETGVAAQIAEPLADVQMTTYYISTYGLGHTLVLVAVILAGIPSQHSFCQRMSRKQLVKLFPGEGKVFNIYVVQSWK